MPKSTVRLNIPRKPHGQTATVLTTLAGESLPTGTQFFIVDTGANNWTLQVHQGPNDGETFSVRCDPGQTPIWIQLYKQSQLP